MNMRLLCSFLFLSCLLNRSYVSSEDFSSGAGSGTWLQDMANAGPGLKNPFPSCSGSSCPNTQPHIFDLENIENGVDDELGREVTNNNEDKHILPKDYIEKLEAIKVPEVNTNSVDKLGQPIMSVSDSLDTSGVTSQDILSQEGLLGAVILDNQNLVTKREELQMLLMGGTLSFGIKNDFLEAAGTKAVEGLVCKGSLGGLCGHGSLSGMNDVLKNMDSEKHNSWLNVTQFDIVQLSWKIFASSTLELKLQAKLTLNFSGMLSFLSGSTVDVTIMVSLDLHQNEPGQMLFSIKRCQAVLTGIQVNTHKFSTVMESMMKWSLNISLPNILCPVVRFWFYIINQQLTILKNIASFGMLGDNNLPSTPQPMVYEQSYYMDFKNKHFPASFINWLIKKRSLLMTSDTLLA